VSTFEQWAQLGVQRNVGAVFEVWRQLDRKPGDAMGWEEYLALVRLVSPLGTGGAAVAVEYPAKIDAGRTFWLEAWSDTPDRRLLSKERLRGFLAACFQLGAEYVATDCTLHPTSIYTRLGFTEVSPHVFAARRDPLLFDPALGLRREGHEQWGRVRGGRRVRDRGMPRDVF
jgi:hypothetical protein